MSALPVAPLDRFTAEEVAAARRGAAGNKRLIEALEESAGITPAAFAQRLAQSFGYPLITLEALARFTPAFDVLPYAEAAARECLLLRRDGALVGVLADPFDTASQAGIDDAFAPQDWYLIHRSDLTAYLAQYEETVQATESLLAATQRAGASGSAVEELSLKSISGDSSPAVRIVHSTIYDGFKAGASDLHLESVANGLVIKYRIDGVLVAGGAIEGAALAEQVISRLKIMSELDIAERRIPQDGRFKVAMKGREIDFRVSVMPSIFGEDAVVRILDKQSLADSIRGLRLEFLGFDAHSLQVLRRLAREPHGMLLVTGPTGSGKTTTLYALISEINHGKDKIITIEDPVEYQLPGVLQIPVNDKKGLSFARGLRSILRHDPDKIMVGEIRDQETAQIAVQSALTGHLVFTTVHANNVFDVIGRFLHMGVDPYSFVSALNGIVAQRLLRMNCSQCAQPEAPVASLLRESGIDDARAQRFLFKKGQGCGHCRGSGYKGRKAVAEVLNLNDELRDLIVERAPIRRIKEAAQRQGLITLRDAALALVQSGETDLAEVNRVTFVS